MITSSRINRELRVSSRTLGYALHDLVSCSVIIMVCILVYPMVYMYDKFLKKAILSTQLRTRNK